MLSCYNVHIDSNKKQTKCTHIQNLPTQIGLGLSSLISQLRSARQTDNIYSRLANSLALLKKHLTNQSLLYVPTVLFMRTMSVPESVSIAPGQWISNLSRRFLYVEYEAE